MRFLLITLLVLSFVDSWGQINVELFFYETCSNDVVELNYSIDDLNSGNNNISDGANVQLSKPGVYMISVAIQRAGYLGHHSEVLEINNVEKLIDTISIPRITFSTDGALHSRFWAYTNCDQICDGLEIDNYTNGMSRVRGVFHSGKPSEIERFREDGTLEQKEYFVLGTISRTRVNYYNLDGLLDSYEIIRNRKKKTITLTYNSSGMLVNKSTVRHNIEKNR